MKIIVFVEEIYNEKFCLLEWNYNDNVSDVIAWLIIGFQAMLVGKNFVSMLSKLE